MGTSEPSDSSTFSKSTHSNKTNDRDKNRRSQFSFSVYRKITGTEGKVLEGGGSESSDEGSEIVGDAELLEVGVVGWKGRGGGRRRGGGGGGGNGGRDLGRDGDAVGEGLDAVGVLGGLGGNGGLDLFGPLGGLGGQLLRLLGGLRDEIGDPGGGGGGGGEGLGLLRRFFGEGLRSLPQVLHCWLGSVFSLSAGAEEREREREVEGGRQRRKSNGKGGERLEVRFGIRQRIGAVVHFIPFFLIIILLFDK